MLTTAVQLGLLPLAEWQDMGQRRGSVVVSAYATRHASPAQQAPHRPFQPARHQHTGPSRHLASTSGPPTHLRGRPLSQEVPAHLPTACRSNERHAEHAAS